MKKAFVFLLTAVMLAQAAFGGGGAGDKPAGQQKTVLRWGTVVAEGNVTVQMMRRVAEEVNSKTGGRVEIQVFANGVLGTARDLVEGVQSGMVDMTIEGPGYFAGMVPVATVLDAPFIYRDAEHMAKVYKSPILEKIGAEFIKKNLRILGAANYGTRHLTTGKIEVHSVKDVQNLKIRVPESKGYVEMINSWGAKPTPMALTELYMALQTNVVDGQENPLPTINAQKFYEVQKYVILTGHITTANIVFINEGVWQKISPEDQKIIQTAVDNGIVWNDGEIKRLEQELVSELTAKGMIFITPDRESFRTVTGPWITRQFEADWGKGLWEQIQDVK
jgi:tripartite ATP-independent transporter DctP family solute receptor